MKRIASKAIASEMPAEYPQQDQVLSRGASSPKVGRVVGGGYNGRIP